MRLYKYLASNLELHSATAQRAARKQECVRAAEMLKTLWQFRQISRVMQATDTQQRILVAAYASQRSARTAELVLTSLLAQ